jgi:hypothetical protein
MKRPLGIPKRRLIDSIKLILKEMGYDGVEWINVAHDRV